MNNLTSITICDFRSMPFKAKCDLVMFSTYVHFRKMSDEDVTVFLYYTGRFFIEIFYSKKKESDILVNAFEGTKQLESYITEINLEELLTN